MNPESIIVPGDFVLDFSFLRGMLDYMDRVRSCTLKWGHYPNSRDIRTASGPHNIVSPTDSRVRIVSAAPRRNGPGW